MELSHTRLVPAPPDRVWEALNDPDTLKACIPGCESFVREPDGTWSTTVALKIGPVSARFAGRVELADVTPPTGYTLKFEGQGGAAGFANGSAKVGLSSADGGRLKPTLELLFTSFAQFLANSICTGSSFTLL